MGLGWTFKRSRHIARSMVIGLIAGGMVLWLAAAEAAAPAVFSVCVNDAAQVKGDRILLGAVATLTGPEDMCARAARIDLGAAPAPGKERRFPGRAIAAALSDCTWLPEGGRFQIPDWVRVQGAFQTIPETSFEKVLTAYANRVAGADEVVVSRVKVRGADPLPLGAVALTPLGHGNRPVKGHVSLRLAVRVDGKDCGQVTVSGWVDRYARIVCAERHLPRGTILSPADLCIRRINVTRAPARLVQDPAVAVGKALRSALRRGACLRRHMLQAPSLVEKGDRVKLLAVTDRLRVSTLGIAKADAGRGDQIRVENVASGQTVVGRVTGRGVVEVLF